jgi:hypothetical protein
MKTKLLCAINEVDENTVVSRRWGWTEKRNNVFRGDYWNGAALQ